MDLGPHASFIVISYGIAALVVAGLIGWVVLDHRAQKRHLQSLEARGIKRTA
jgi:heme exporter protein D